MYLFRTCLSALRMWIPPAVLIGTAAGLSVYVIAKFIRERRKADEKTPDYIALHELAKDLHRQSLQAVNIGRKLRSMEFGGSEAADVTISWESVSSRNGEENISVSGGQEVTADYLEAVLDETGEQIEETILNLIGWYQGNIGPLPFPSDDFSVRRNSPDTVSAKRQQNDFACQQNSQQNDSANHDKSQKDDSRQPDPDRNMWRLAWKLRDCEWKKEAYPSKKEAHKREHEIWEEHPLEEQSGIIYADFITAKELDRKIEQWERTWRRDDE